MLFHIVHNCSILKTLKDKENQCSFKYDTKETCLLVLLMLVILMRILMLLNVRTEYVDVDAEFLLRLCPCTVREICRNY